MAVVGLGTDLVEIRRLVASADPESALAKRVLRPFELDVLAKRLEKSEQRAACYLATRFAAKEAFAKAFGTGIGKEISFQDIEIRNLDNGAPYLVYSDRLSALLQNQGLSGLVSISDEKDYATATVILQHINT